MATNNLLDTSTVSFSDIIGNGKTYEVPLYQRDYSWKRDHWEDLWEDILSVHNKDAIHYMSSIVLQNKGNRHYSIIDGQQRLATLSLIVLATIKALQSLIDKGNEPEYNAERINLLQRKFLGDKDPASLTYSAKLQLNENNNSFYQKHLMVFRPPQNERRLRDSDKLLWQAYNFFADSIAKLFAESNNGEALANFLNKTVAEKLMFIQIVVEDEISAYTVFETLNSRGERLTVSDLLKNYLFSLATSTDLPHIREQWQRIVDSIGLQKFPTFLRHYWISQHPLIRHEHLFRAMKEGVRTSPQVIELLDALEHNAQVYTALSSAADPFWIGEKEQRRWIRELELFHEKQALPLLLAAHNKLSPQEFTKVLRIVAVVTFRYTVIGGLHTNLKETVYNRAAIKLSSGELTTARDVATEVQPLYTSDTDFRNAFSTASIGTKMKKKLVRYILFAIENHKSRTDIDYEDSPATIEHILPEHESGEWMDSFPKAVHELYVYRLGNYTLLEDDKNKECGTKPFVEKRAIYGTSQYAITKDITASDWTPTTLEHRQMRLAIAATAVWRLPYFDA